MLAWRRAAPAEELASWAELIALNDAVGRGIGRLHDLCKGHGEAAYDVALAELAEADADGWVGAAAAEADGTSALATVATALLALRSAFVEMRVRPSGHALSHSNIQTPTATPTAPRPAMHFRAPTIRTHTRHFGFLRVKKKKDQS